MPRPRRQSRTRHSLRVQDLPIYDSLWLAIGWDSSRAWPGGLLQTLDDCRAVYEASRDLMLSVKFNDNPADALSPYRCTPGRRPWCWW